jgi:hypothetical protein
MHGPPKRGGASYDTFRATVHFGGLQWILVKMRTMQRESGETKDELELGEALLK